MQSWEIKNSKAKYRFLFFNQELHNINHVINEGFYVLKQPWLDRSCSLIKYQTRLSVKIPTRYKLHVWLWIIWYIEHKENMQDAKFDLITRSWGRTSLVEELSHYKEWSWSHTECNFSKWSLYLTSLKEDKINDATSRIVITVIKHISATACNLISA